MERRRGRIRDRYIPYTYRGNYPRGGRNGGMFGRSRSRGNTNGRWRYDHRHVQNQPTRQRGSTCVTDEIEILQRKDPSEIILTLNACVFDEYLGLSETDETISLSLLKLLNKGFTSDATPALRLGVINRMIENEFILKITKRIKERVCEDGIDMYRDAVFSILRIMNCVCIHNPNAMRCIQGSYVKIAELMILILSSRNWVKLISDSEESDMTNNIDSAEEMNSEESDMTSNIDSAEEINSEESDMSNIDSAEEINSEESDMTSNIDSAEEINSEESDMTSIIESAEEINSEESDMTSNIDSAEEMKYVNRPSLDESDDSLEAEMDTEPFGNATPENTHQLLPSMLHKSHTNVTMSWGATGCLAALCKLYTEFDNKRKALVQWRPKRQHHALSSIGMHDDDFREIPIIPRLEDINGKIDPQLRVNKAIGGYNSVDDYLDLQFKLLREDFVGPLREGINAYTGQHSAMKCKHNIQESETYENVQIEDAFYGDGLNHVLSFDISKLKHIMWSTTARLKCDSLVCLSSDCFRTLYFATIVDREIALRRKGRLHVKFEHDPKQIKLLMGDTFTMLVPTAYFEAYRPILVSLQATKIDELPFEKYIVKCETDVLPPKYLLRGADGASFDLRPLFDLDYKVYRKRRLSLSSLRADYSHPKFSEESHDLERVKILEECWPNETQLHLDTSQLNALKTALTKEFSIIQGPPGCGKTFLGLKIVKILLHNKHRWEKQDGTRAQLLIVCHTNHALDQFMEGICTIFDGDILRVGSRSSSDALKGLNASLIRSKFRNAKRFPSNLYDGRCIANCDLISLKEDNLHIKKIKLLRCNIVKEAELKDEMGMFYQQFLQSMRSSKVLPKWHYLGHSIMVDWLGIIDMVKEIEASLQYRTRKELKIELNLDEQRTGLEYIALDLDENNDNELKRVPTDSIQRIAQERSILISTIKHILRTTKPMPDADVPVDGNIFSALLTRNKRWSLYTKWVQERCQKLNLEFENSLGSINAANARVKEITMMENRYLFSNADVIGMTTTGAAKNKTVLREIKPTIMIVEEAAQVLESHIISSLTSGCEQLILIGDHKQLKPKPSNYRLEMNYKMDLSLFERMVHNGIKCDCLEIQHRMRPEIARNVRHVYGTLVDHDSVKQYEPIKGVGHNMFFIDHTVNEGNDNELKGFTNEHEAKYIIALCKYLLLQEYEPSRITILTMYKAQLCLLKREKSILENYALGDVRVTTVDDYQGEENDIILLSLVRSNSYGWVGHIASENRVCVAFSRAKKGFYILGNFENLAKAPAPILWQSIITDMKRIGLFGRALPLICQNHPNDDGIMAKHPDDFRLAPEGGCQKFCNIPLECGHVCWKYCHAYDREHKNVACNKPCEKKCKNGHQCKLACREKCLCQQEIIVTLPGCKHVTNVKCSLALEEYTCMVPVSVRLSECGHETRLPCSVNPKDYKCREKCAKKLACGHICDRWCCVQCEPCMTRCDLVMDCGHSCPQKCGTTNNIPREEESRVAMSRCRNGHLSCCQTLCKEKFKCGHTCKGTCSTCYHGRCHVFCREKCNCSLICGHKCDGRCGLCIPCSEKCTRRCYHQCCPNKCIDICKPCRKRCIWKCPHFECKQICGKPCDRPRCDKPCLKLLPCRHECIGMCGDPCPTWCRICNADRINTVKFGKDSPDSRYVQLEDCGHLIKCDIMDEYMDCDEGLCFKICPKCKQEIRTTSGNRYEDTVNTFYLKLNELKQHFFDNTELRDKLVDKLQRKVRISDDEAEHCGIESYSQYLKTCDFTVMECRQVLTILNQLSVVCFVKSISECNSYTIQDAITLFPHVSRCISSEEQAHEMEMEVKRYLDKRQLQELEAVTMSHSTSHNELKKIIDIAWAVLNNAGAYTDANREEVQNCIQKLSETHDMSHSLLKVRIVLADIGKGIVINDGRTTVVNGEEEIVNDYIRIDYSLIMSILQHSCLDDLAHPKVLSQASNCELEDGEIDEDRSEISENTVTGMFEGKLFEENKNIQDNSKTSMNINDDLEEGEIPENNEHSKCTVICANGKVVHTENYIPNDDTHVASTNEQPTITIKMLTWSGIPYFHSKQSQFHVNPVSNRMIDLQTSDKNEIGDTKKRSEMKHSSMLGINKGKISNTKKAVTPRTIQKTDKNVIRNIGIHSPETKHSRKRRASVHYGDVEPHNSKRISDRKDSEKSRASVHYLDVEPHNSKRISDRKDSEKSNRRYRDSGLSLDPRDKRKEYSKSRTRTSFGLTHTGKSTFPTEPGRKMIVHTVPDHTEEGQLNQSDLRHLIKKRGPASAKTDLRGTTNKYGPANAETDLRDTINKLRETKTHSINNDMGTFNTLQLGEGI